jgi:hypothetical protein
VKLAPSNQFPEDWREITSSRRRVILLARRVVGVLPPFDQPATLEPIQSIRQDVARNPLRRRKEFRKAMLVIQKQIANDQQCPPVTNQIKRTGDWTRRTQRGVPMRMFLRLCRHTDQYTQRLALYK